MELTENKYTMLVGSLNELLQGENRILLKGYDLKSLIEKIDKAKKNKSL